jgi:hypothetical protein
MQEVKTEMAKSSTTAAWRCSWLYVLPREQEKQCPFYAATKEDKDEEPGARKIDHSIV